MSSKNITQITLRANEELVKRTKQKSNRRFYMVGKQVWTNKAEPGKPADWDFVGIDFIDTFAAMSSAEQTVIRFLKSNIHWDKDLNSYNYVVFMGPDSVYFDSTAHDSIKYETFLRAFNLLYKKDLVRRIKKYHYMMNPDFFFPAGEASNHFELIWAQAKSCK